MYGGRYIFDDDKMPLNIQFFVFPFQNNSWFLNFLTLMWNDVPKTELS